MRKHLLPPFLSLLLSLQAWAGQMAVITTDWLRVRAEPTTKAEVISVVYEGEQFRILDRKKKWVQIFLPKPLDRSGWVATRVGEDVYVRIANTSVGEDVPDPRSSFLYNYMYWVIAGIVLLGSALIVVIKKFPHWYLLLFHDLRNLFRLCRNDRHFPSADQELGVCVQLFKGAAIRKGGSKGKQKNEFEAESCLFSGLFPVAAQVSDYLIRVLKRDEKEVAALLYHVISIILNEILREAKDENHSGSHQ